MTTSARRSTEPRALVASRPLSFVVSGVPQPQAALSTGKTGKSYYRNGRDLKPWRRAVTAAARTAIADAGWTTVARHVPVELEVTYWLPRPPSVSETARPLPSVRPDKQHLDRAVEDALTEAGVWVDDAQVTDGGSRLLAVEGTVEFRAWYRHEGATGSQHEVSRFARVDGAWWYVDGR